MPTMTDHHIRTTCRLCDSDQLELVLDLGETALANEVWDDPSKQQDTFPLRLVQCGACGHMQNPVVVDPERLFRKYTYTSGLTEAYRKHLHGYARQIEPGLDSDDLLVEIGGNDGTLGGAFDYSAGIRYVNVDPSDVKQKHGIRIKEFFTPDLARGIRSEHGPAKAIVANHVFAHVDDLHDMAEGVRELLADDGTFWCEVGHGPTQLNSGCLDVVYHEHLSFHDKGSFHRFWLKHGLAVVDYETNGAQGGSLRCRIEKASGNEDPEKPRKVFPVSGLKCKPFDLPRIKAAAGHLRGLGELARQASAFGNERGDGPGAAIFGAPAKLTTLLEIMREKEHGLWHGFDTVFDDSPRKQGRYTPGTHIPISAPVPEMMNRYDFMLIASWNFADDIIARFPGYTGTWIVPLPEVRFVPGGGR